MTNIKNWTIKDIENMTQADATAMAFEKMNIKGYTVYFVDFSESFGYSCLVFKNGHHIRYANNYELHYLHMHKPRGELREMFISRLNNILFTDDEISEPLKSYAEYQRKEYYLRNYYGMQVNYISIFSTGRVLDAEGMVYDPISFAYYSDAEFVKRHVELFDALQKAKAATAENYEYQKNAFLDEMANHEYHINLQADFDTLGAFGKIQWHGDDGAALQKYFDELHFSDLQRRAYLAARSEHLKMAVENGWY